MSPIKVFLDIWTFNMNCFHLTFNRSVQLVEYLCITIQSVDHIPPFHSNTRKTFSKSRALSIVSIQWKIYEPQYGDKDLLAPILLEIRHHHRCHLLSVFLGKIGMKVIFVLITDITRCNLWAFAGILKFQLLKQGQLNIDQNYSKIFRCWL